MVIICLSLWRRERTELRAKRFGDLIIEVVDGNQFITLDKERLSKTRQGEDPRNMRHFRLSGLFALLSCYDLLEVLLHETRSCGRSWCAYVSQPGKNKKDPCKACLKDGPWFINSPSGVNKIAGAVKKMVVISEIDVGGRKISNTSIRKMVVSSLLRENVP